LAADLDSKTKQVTANEATIQKFRGEMMIATDNLHTYGRSLGNYARQIRGQEEKLKAKDALIRDIQAEDEAKQLRISELETRLLQLKAEELLPPTWQYERLPNRAPGSLTALPIC
jgi:chromosome segregation ATPase